MKISTEIKRVALDSVIDIKELSDEQVTNWCGDVIEDSIQILDYQKYHDITVETNFSIIDICQIKEPIYINNPKETEMNVEIGSHVEVFKEPIIINNPSEGEMQNGDDKAMTIVIVSPNLKYYIESPETELQDDTQQISSVQVLGQ